MDKNCKTKLSYALAGFCTGALAVALAFWLPSKMFSPQSRLVSMMQDITEICEDNMSTPREGDEQLLEYLTKNAPGAAQHIVQIICNGAAMTRDGDREEYFNEVSSELQKEIKNTSGAVLRMYSKLDGSSEVMDRFRSIPDIGTLTNPNQYVQQKDIYDHQPSHRREIQRVSERSLLSEGTKNGATFTLRVVPNIVDGMEQPIEMDKACTAIQERLNAFGIKEVSIMAQSRDKILIQVPVTEDAEVNALRDNVTRSAKLELLKVHPNSEAILADVDPETRRPRAVPTGFRVMKHVFEDNQGKKHESDLVIEHRPNAQSQEVYITGKDIAAANPDYQRKGYVNVTLSTSGAYKMKKLTSSMELGRDRLAVVLDDKVVSAPVVQDTLYKEFSISGLTINQIKILSNPLTNKLEVL